MRLKTDAFRNVCTTIKNAIDTKGVTLYTETLELKASGKNLKLNVTNREYYVSINFSLDAEETFNAAVNAQLFLSLISKITTEYVDLIIKDNYVEIVGNGAYKIPLIYVNDKPMVLPEISINNVTNQFKIKSDILISVANNNSKELIRGGQAGGIRPVQQYYYLDKYGAITFTTGACVNDFTLDGDIKVLLSDKVVKLFKLFKNTTEVDFEIGQDALDDFIQTKLRFSAGNITITMIMPGSDLISSVPATKIRETAKADMPYSVVINRVEMLDTLHRILLFSKDDNNYGKLSFSKSSLIISDWSENNSETINFKNMCNIGDEYTANININNLELMLSGSDDEYITVSFGNKKSLVIKKTNVYDLIPELKVV